MQVPMRVICWASRNFFDDLVVMGGEWKAIAETVSKPFTETE
jgi:hypothetical protein